MSTIGRGRVQLFWFLTVKRFEFTNICIKIDWTKDRNELANYFEPASFSTWLSIFRHPARRSKKRSRVRRLLIIFSHNTWWDFKLIFFFSGANLFTEENNKLSLIVLHTRRRRWSMKWRNLLQFGLWVRFMNDLLSLMTLES